jgi:hypothetical protein
MVQRAQAARRRQEQLEFERGEREAAEWAKRTARQLNTNPGLRRAAGVVAQVAGAPAGVVRGAYHDGRAIRGGLDFVLDLTSPFALERQRALKTAAAISRGAVDYVSSRAAQPELAIRDVRRAGDALNRDLNPGATPESPTVLGEAARRLRIGMNEGEAAYTVGTILAPVVGELKIASKLGRFAPPGPAKYIAMGATPAQAAELAEPYVKGMGHHATQPRRVKKMRDLPVVKTVAAAVKQPDLPKAMFGEANVPEGFLDSRFNVLKPENVEKGQFYRNHYGVDDRLYGGRLPNGLGWSGRALGWQRYGPYERILYGTPGATRALIYAPTTAFGVLGQIPDPEAGR